MSGTPSSGGEHRHEPEGGEVAEPQSETATQPRTRPCANCDRQHRTGCESTELEAVVRVAAELLREMWLPQKLHGAQHEPEGHRRGEDHADRDRGGNLGAGGGEHRAHSACGGVPRVLQVRLPGRLVHERRHGREVDERGAGAYERGQPVTGERAVGDLGGIGERDDGAAPERTQRQRDRLGRRAAREPAGERRGGVERPQRVDVPGLERPGDERPPGAERRDGTP